LAQILAKESKSRQSKTIEMLEFCERKQLAADQRKA
jgi:hypothetical protein